MNIYSTDSDEETKVVFVKDCEELYNETHEKAPKEMTEAELHSGKSSIFKEPHQKEGPQQVFQILVTIECSLSP